MAPMFVCVARVVAAVGAVAVAVAVAVVVVFVFVWLVAALDREGQRAQHTSPSYHHHHHRVNHVAHVHHRLDSDRVLLYLLSFRSWPLHSSHSY